MSEDLSTLAGLLEAVWSRLDRAKDDLAAPARTIALASVAPGGGASVRMVVLRGADRATNTLAFWTNRASGKVAGLTADKRAEAMFWDQRTNLQVRFGLETEISEGPRDIWMSLGPGTRSNYARSPLPGEPLGRPEDYQPEPDPAMFSVIEGRILWIDVLHLGDDLHFRAKFPAARLSDATWIAP